MLKKLKSNSRGFTIIEVMIVLAVAALIILIVLLAVPALQRSSRNTTIKNDASAIQTGIGNFANNNNGELPTCVNQNGTSVMIGTTCSTPGTGNEVAKVQGSTIVYKVGTPSADPYGTVGSQISSPAAVTDSTIEAGDVSVDFGYACDGTADSRATSVFYTIENGGGKVSLECLDS